jgi:simple sugar transport system permease protein
VSVLLLLLAQTIRICVPYVCAATGGVLSERSGVVNIALEGILLASGLGAVVAHVATGSAAVGLLVGVAVGVAMGAAHAFLVVRVRVDAILSGIALNLLAAGGTRFLLRALYRSSSNSPPVDGFRVAEGWPLLVRTLLDPTLYLAIASLWLTIHLLSRTAFGLRVRATGEDPNAVEAVGLSPAKLRIQAVMLGSAICGLGGVALAYDQHQFQSGMSGGRGFIALAAVVLSGWRPGHAAVACVGFAALDALQVVLQDRARVAHDLVQMVPYVVTLVVLAVAGQRRRAWAQPPAALGREL